MVVVAETGHLSTKMQRDAIKQRMVDPDDPLKIVIVRDMWLTGTDIPCLHTLYVDKPMKRHNMIPALTHNPFLASWRAGWAANRS